MNQNWKILMFIAITTFILYIGYQVYLSVSGQNAQFTKTVTPISLDLGEEVLNYIEEKDGSILVRDEGLDNK